MRSLKSVIVCSLSLLLTLSSFYCCAYSKAQYRKAEKIFETVNFEKTFDHQLNQLVKSFQSNPLFADHEKELRHLFQGMMDYKALKNQTIQFYAQNFTESELDELIKFNQSPLGQKMQTKLPELSEMIMKQVQHKIADNHDKIEEQMMSIIKSEAVKLLSSNN
jgi:hypothetical protein